MYVHRQLGVSVLGMHKSPCTYKSMYIPTFLSVYLCRHKSGQVCMTLSMYDGMHRCMHVFMSV